MKKKKNKKLQSLKKLFHQIDKQMPLKRGKTWSTLPTIKQLRKRFNSGKYE